MKQFTRLLSVKTNGKGLHNCTPQVEGWVRHCQVTTGLLTIFLQHTSASLTIQENADPDVVLDLNTFLDQLVPEDPWRYRHNQEGPDDMPAHIRAMLTTTHLTVPVMSAHLALGAWQGIYVFEHRTRPHRRSLALHLFGE